MTKMLFSPLKIGNLTLKNRIAVAPMGSEPNTSGWLSEQNLAAYELRAKGGAAVVTRGETLIGHPTDSAHGNLCNMADERFMSTHLQLTDVIHQHNALANIELLHSGARAHPKYTNGIIWGPSAEMGVYGAPVLEMTEEMMEEVAEAFAHAAFVAKFGGFDMIMIHGGHGWLLSQFLSPIYNKRKDRYGGSIENRARFPLMVIKRIRQRVGEGFPIEYRMSGGEFIEGGYGLDEAIEFARIIDGKVDLIHVSATSFKDINSGCRMFPSAFLPHGVNTYLAAAIKKAVKTPVATVGALSDPNMMEEILTSGAADLIVVGRQILADPYFPKKIQKEQLDKVRPCIRCNHCLSLDFVPYVPLCSGISQCTVNPIIGRELRESYYQPKPTPKKVLIAGGGPGGLEAAITAAKQGHQVILCEKTGELGGILQRATKDVYFKADLRRFMKYQIREAKNQPLIEIRLNTKVTPELVQETAPDLLICAIGAKPKKLDIPGIDLPLVKSILEVHNGQSKIGHNVVIIGGGLAGCEEGLYLAQQGHNVTILETQKEVASDAPILHLKALLLEFAKLPEKLHILTNSEAVKITEKGVFFKTKAAEEKFILADTIFIAAGLTIPHKEIEQLRAATDEFIVVGDSLKPGKVLQAVHSGYFAGKNG